jgi:hypothetical protein
VLTFKNALRKVFIMNYHHSLSRLISSLTHYLFPFILGVVWLPLAQAATDCAAQSDIPTAECEALVAIYDDLNGASWETSPSNGWNENDSPCNWWGVSCVGSPPTNVKVIYLYEQNFSGSLPTELGNLTFLEKLILQSFWTYSNGTWSWSSAINGSIPTELGNLTSLKVLDLSDNNLTGAIPTELGNLTNLEILDLSYNNLSGSIPTELGNLTNLQTLDLNRNDLSGSIPTELGSLTNLQTLNLEYNDFTGSIPVELGNLTNLQHLYLSHYYYSNTYNAGLTGSIPTELGNLTNLQTLNLNGNDLSGSIPTELGNLSSLQTLDLSYNKLTGSIPAELGNLSSLQYLYLDGYSNDVSTLSGSIPTELGNLSNLIELRLSYNQLTGDIPSSFIASNLPSLNYLRLECNQLTASDTNVIAFLDSIQNYSWWTGSYWTNNAENWQGESSSCPSNSPPKAPTNLVAEGTSQTEIDLTWTDNSIIETGFVVERDGTPIATPTTATYSDTGLTCSTTYSYSVFATNTIGDSTSSSTINETTLPCTPTDFTATLFSTSQIELAWTDVADETGYTIERNGVQITTLTANTTSYSDTGLSSDTTYNYSIIATNANGESQAATAVETTSITTPDAPTSLIVTTISETALDLSWIDNSYVENGFIIKRNGTSITTTTADTVNYSDTSLTCNTTYSYSVIATNSVGDSSPSSTVSKTTSPCTPTDFIATQISTSQIDLTWTDVADETGYTIKRDGTTITTTAADTTSYSDTGLSSDGTYTYSVIATNANGDSQSATAVGTTSSTAPNAPTGLTTTVISQTAIDLTWTDNSDDENGFIVNRNGTPIATPTTTTGIVNYSDTGLTCSTTYNYSVVATNAIGESTSSSSISQTTSPCTPTGLSATPVSTSKINLTWTDVADETGYVIEQNGIEIATIAANTTIYSDTDLSCAGTYNYSVIATNANGDSQPATIVGTTTSTNCPTLPSDFTATAVSSNRINLSWTDNASNETNFKIERAGILVATRSPNVTSYSDIGLNCETSYTYSLTVNNSFGNSLPVFTSATTSTCPAPSEPSGPKPSYQLEIDKIGAGGKVTADGINCGSDCSQIYESGTELTLTTTLNDGWSLKEWGGDCDSNGHVSVTNGDKSCTVTFVQERTLTIQTTGQGTVEDCGTECTQTYLDGETVKLTPIPATGGWHFIEWSGNCDAEGQVQMTDEQSCTAHFDRLNISLSPTTLNIIEGSTIDSYIVELNTAPKTTITLSPNGNNGNDELSFSPSTLTFNQNNWYIPQRITVVDTNDNLPQGQHSHTITHTITSSNADYNNISIDDVTINVIDNDELLSTEILLSTNDVIVVEGFTGSYSIRLMNQPQSNVSIQLSDALQNPSEPDQTYLSPEQLIFTPENWNIPQNVEISVNDDQLFEGQHDHASIKHHVTSEDPTYQDFTIKDVNVHVIDNDGTSNLLTVTLTGEGEGTVNSEPAGINCGTECVYEYPNGTEILLTAEANNGSQFANWSGQCSGDDAQIQVTLLEAQTCEAKFEIDSAKRVSLEGGITLVCEDCTIENFAAEAVDAQPTPPGDYSFPEGLVDFELSDLPTDSPTEFAIYYSNLDLLKNNGLDNFIYRKYGPIIPGDYESADWYNFSNVTIELATLNGEPQLKVTLLLVDGELGDDTGVDGRIIDAGGLAISTATDTPIANNDDLLPVVENTETQPIASETQTTEAQTTEAQTTEEQTTEVQTTEDQTTEDQTTEETASTTGTGTINEPTIVVPTDVLASDVIVPDSTIGEIFNAKDQIFREPTLITEQGSVSNAIFEADVENSGLISNSLIGPEATLTGATLSGDMINEGTIADVNFVGQSLIGGTLSGNVTNNSEVGGIIQDVQLAAGATLTGGKIGGDINAAPDSTLSDVQLIAGTRISGGTLTGEITGDPDNPPLITAAEIAPGAVLSNVRLSPTVDLPADVVLGPGVILPSEPPTLEDFGLDIEDLAALDAESLAELEPGVFAVITPEQLAMIPPEGFGGLQQEQLAEVQAETLESLSLEQLAQMPVEALGGLTEENMEGMPDELMGELSGEQLAEIKPEAVAGMEQEQLAAISPETMSTMSSEQMGELPKETLGGLSTQQLAQLPTQALSGLKSDNMGGLSTDVLNDFTPEHLSALDAGEFTQMSSEEVSKLFTNFDANKISIQNAAQLVPPGWQIDTQSGEITAPEGAKLTPRTFPASDGVPAAVQLPSMADIEQGMGLGGQGTSVKENMTRSLENEDLTDFVLSQNEQTGILLVEGTGDSEGINYSFIPDVDNVIQVDGDKIPIGLSVTEGGFYTITTPDEKQYKVVPAPQNPIALSEVLDGGEVVIGKRGEVMMDIPDSDTRKRGKPRQVAMFDPFIEPAPDDLCVEIAPGDIVCDFENAPPSQQPGIHLEANTRAAYKNQQQAKVVFPDGTAQLITPTLLSPDVFAELGFEFEGVEDIVFNANGIFYVSYQGQPYFIIPKFEVVIEEVTEEEIADEKDEQPGDSSIVVNNDGTLTYTVVIDVDERNTRKRGQPRQVMQFQPEIQVAPDDLCVEIAPGDIVCDFE